MRKDMEKEVREILEAAGLENISTYAEENPIHGDSVHEMGTARMGRDPETSFLNGYNQSHEIPNLFITDGSAMSSSGHSSPSDRKSTRLNSSHVAISYAVFCWKQ